MDNLEQSFLDFIKEHDLFSPHHKVLVAVSAGVDSVVLAHLMHKMGFQIALAHANFQLRGKDADRDELFVRALASEWGVPFFVQHFDTARVAEDQGISLQMAARELRYAWFQKLLKQEGYHRVATAHQQNDVLETMLLNLSRGTGLRGLQGIRPRRGQIIRPLLFATKEQVVTYAHEKALEWREDQSNQQDYYHRNLIRNKVIPVLKELNPRLEAAAAHTAEIMSVAQKIFQAHVEELTAQIISQHGEHINLDLEQLRKCPLPIWFELLRTYGFNYSQVTEMARSGVGSLFYSGNYQLNVDRQHIIISPKDVSATSGFEIAKADPRSWQQNHITWELSQTAASDYHIQDDPQVGAWDLDKLRFPLQVRNWKPGDWFHPLGMGHKKKLSDFLIDEKVPANYKPAIQVMTSGEEIIWLVGHRIDDRYKITDQTKTVLEIRKVED